MSLGSSISPRMVRLPGGRRYMRLAAIVVAVFLTVSSSAQQSVPKTTAPAPRKAAPRKAGPNGDKAGAKKPAAEDFSWLQDLLKNKELMAEFEKLGKKLVESVHYPAARNQSRILSRLPDSTLLYVAFPNYGETMHTALEIFQQELRESAELRAFLQKNKLDAVEPKIESGIQKFYELSQFLGDEVVITGTLQGKEPDFLLVAEVKKPGVKEFLAKLNEELIANKNDRLRIIEPQELTASDAGAKEAPIVLVRPDLLAVGFGMASLRNLNAQVDQSGSRFTSSPLGQRVAQSYQSGTNSVFGLDLQKVVGLAQNVPQARMMLEKTGFADVKYLVTENRMGAGRSANQVELTFNGPRHGIASWIATAAPMGGLDFVSSNAAIAGDVMFKSPALIFDDVREIAGDAAFASLPQMEAQLNVNLKQDLLRKLDGEIAFEMQMPPMPASTGQPKPAAGPGAFKLIFRVNDPAGLQQTLSRLLAMAPMKSGTREEDGVTFHTLSTPAPGGQAIEINYFFMDGYLVIASDAATASAAVRAHRSGDSLGKSAKLRESQAGDQATNASMMFYQNAGQMLGPMLAQLPPELQQLLPATNTDAIDTKPNVFFVNATETSFRGSTSNNVNTDVSIVAIIAAIAVPNLLRSRMAANEVAAASTVRTLNTSQLTYETAYPGKGYARSLAVLGPPPSGDCSAHLVASSHACLLDNVLGNAKCTAGQWCQKGQYRYSMRTTCTQSNCSSYVVTATPANSESGKKSFCSSVDAVVREHTGAPLETPLTAAQCRAWPPLR